MNAAAALALAPRRDWRGLVASLPDDRVPVIKQWASTVGGVAAAYTLGRWWTPDALATAMANELTRRRLAAVQARRDRFRVVK